MREIETQATLAEHEINTVKTARSAKHRDIRKLELTTNELKNLPADTKVYQGVGKMFVLPAKKSITSTHSYGDLGSCLVRHQTLIGNCWPKSRSWDWMLRISTRKCTIWKRRTTIAENTSIRSLGAGRRFLEPACGGCTGYNDYSSYHGTDYALHLWKHRVTWPW